MSDELVTARLFTRWYRLRKRGLVPNLLHDSATGKLYTFDPVGRWESKTWLPHGEFERLVREAEELEAGRKPVSSESVQGGADVREEVA